MTPFNVYPNIALKLRELEHCRYVGLADAFVALINASSRTTYFVAADAAEINRIFIRELSPEIKDPENWQAKIAGNQLGLRSMNEALKSIGIKVAATMELKDSHHEVLFFNGQARLRIAEAPAPAEFTRVLIIDDSLTMRKLLRSYLRLDPSILIAGETESAEEGLHLARTVKPDVISLDINLPGMNGVEFLEKLRQGGSVPTVLLSSLNIETSQTVMRALDAGATDYMHKPKRSEWPELAPVWIDKLKGAAQSRKSKKSAIGLRRKAEGAKFDWKDVELIAIGSSTGGPQALKSLLSGIPADAPPIVIVQHIPPIFSKALAEHLNLISDLEVTEAINGKFLEPGHAYVAPGGHHLEVVRDGTGHLKMKISDGPALNRHKPAVDVLFQSVAEVSGSRSVGIILTGMGSDGAEGLMKMKTAGSFTIAQDEQSCVVFGMPKEAIQLGAALEVCPLEDIPAFLVDSLALTKKAA